MHATHNLPNYPATHSNPIGGLYNNNPNDLIAPATSQAYVLHSLVPSGMQ